MRSTKLPLWIEAVLGIDPRLPPPHVFALDERELRYGCFHHSAQGFVYEASHSLAVPAEVLGEGPLGAPMRNPRAFQDLVDEMVGELAGPIKEATLVLPDSWLRLIFTEIAELPRKRQAREEVLRWKLKKLVPFRVEDLRISDWQVTPFPSQELPLRLLIGFAIERLISQIEDAFAAAGVEIGRIVNTTLALAASVEHTVEARDLAGLVAVYPEAYTMSFFRRGEPLLYRYKATSEAPAAGAAVHRDLRLTDSFLRQHFPETPISRIFLAAPPEQEEHWLEWIGDEVAARPEPLAFEHFQLSRTQVGPTWLETAPLLGQASEAREAKVVNLARQPFVNRRPVLRLAILLWIIGTALAIHNVRQFTGHWTGTSAYRQRLTDVNQQIREEGQKLTELDRDLVKINLKNENRHTNFLNQLIAYRTFPWSALFDDLEEVVPRDVKLFSVKPSVQLKAQPKKEKRQRGRRSRPATARSSDAESSDAESSIGDSSDSAGGSSRKDETQPLRRGEVRLQLSGISKTEDAVVEFIEVLYASPSFRSPFLPGELIELGGTVRFTLSTIYLTDRATPEPIVQPAAAEALVATAEGAAGSASAMPADSEAPGIETVEVEATPGQPPASAGAGESPRRSTDAGSGAPDTADLIRRSLARRDLAGQDPVRPDPARRDPVRPDPTERDAAERGAAERDPKRVRPAQPRSQIRAGGVPGLLPVAQAGAPQAGTPQPGAPQPAAPQPSAPQPSAPQPSAPQPSAPQPRVPQPSAPQPGGSQPSAPQPGAGNPKPPLPGAPPPGVPQPQPDEPSFPDSPASSPPKVRRNAWVAPEACERHVAREARA